MKFQEQQPWICNAYRCNLGTWKLEPKLTHKSSRKNQHSRNREYYSNNTKVIPIWSITIWYDGDGKCARYESHHDTTFARSHNFIDLQFLIVRKVQILQYFCKKIVNDINGAIYIVAVVNISVIIRQSGNIFLIKKAQSVLFV